MNMKKNLSLIIASLLVVPSVFGANVGDPQEVNIKVYSMWASQNTDCSSPTQVFNDSNASYKDMTANPDFGSGNLTNGNYQCVSVLMSDVIKFKPDYNSDNGNCVQGVESQINVFHSGESSTCPDGTTYTGSDNEDQVCVYFSTAGDSEPELVGKSPFQAPGFLLSNAWTVSGDKVGTFVTDFSGKIEDNGGQCDAQPPTWNFR